MWTSVGVIATVQYGLVELTDDITLSWRVSLYILFLLSIFYKMIHFI
jgi:hypothetical protein